MQGNTTARPAGVLASQARILEALMLRDIKTRFGGSEWGYVVAIGWPLSHVLILLVINGAMGRIAPYGENPALWIATGVVPFMAFNYMSRFIMLGIVLNRPLLFFPVVKITDILFARVLVEVLNAAVIILILFAIFWVYGIDFMPIDLVQACLALLAMMLFGVGFGVINGIVAAAFPFWITGSVLLQIALWLASGVLFVPDVLPQQIKMWLAYLPTLQGVEWMRSAYYEGYGSSILDKTYMISVGAVFLFVGLALERLLRGKMMQ